VTESTALVGYAAVLTGTLTWLFAVAYFFSNERQAGMQAILRYRDNLDRRLRFLRVRYPAARIAWYQLGACLVGVALALLNASFIPLLGIPVVLLGPKLQIERLVAKRVTALDEQIEPWLNAIANALKAGPSLGEAIACSASLLPAPMSQEIDLLVKEYEFGTSLDRALEQFAERIDSRTLFGAVTALQVARNSGGNLPEALENAASALRELARLEGVVRTKTAEGKAQAFVIGAIPVPMVVGIHLMDGHFFEPLLAVFTGHLVIGAAVALWVSAIVLALKILAVDI
jgi:tight adherence protein B